MSLGSRPLCGMRGCYFSVTSVELKSAVPEGMKLSMQKCPSQCGRGSQVLRRGQCEDLGSLGLCFLFCLPNETPTADCYFRM